MIKFIIMKRVFLAILIVVFAVNVRAEELTGHYDDEFFYDDYVSSPADIALENMYDVHKAVQTFCGGLSAELSEISGVSIAGTVVSGAGVATAGGALATGIVKAKTDKEVAQLSEEIAELICKEGGCDADSIEAMSTTEFSERILPLLISAIGQETAASEALSMKLAQDREIAKSKRFGNWRSGLLAGNTATNIVTAVLAGLNKDQSELMLRVTSCNQAVQKLQEAKQAAISAGINPINNPYMQSFNKTINLCGTLNVSDIEKIEKHMTAAMGTGIAGGVVGAVGVGTSVAANTNQIRDDNTDAGKKKEKTLNTVANVASGTNIAIGAIGTGVNISLISLTKKMIQNARQCEDTL